MSSEAKVDPGPSPGSGARGDKRLGLGIAARGARGDKKKRGRPKPPPLCAPCFVVMRAAYLPPCAVQVPSEPFVLPLMMSDFLRSFRTCTEQLWKLPLFFASSAQMKMGAA